MVLAIAVILLILGFAQATAITVCPDGCNYTSIQSAVYAAKPGDTVEVYSGTYNESVILTKNINFKGVDTGSGEPIVNGGLYKDGFDSSLSGFSFQDISSSIPWSYNMAVPNTTLYWIENASEMASKSPTKGLALINKVLKTNPNDAWAWFRKGSILYNSQRYEDSIDAYNESLKIDPYDVIAWNNIGTDLYLLKKYNEAIQAYDEAIQIDPQYALAWEDKGDALKALNQTTDADAAYAKAKELGYTG